jgi:hypothetical protein
MPLDKFQKIRNKFPRINLVEYHAAFPNKPAKAGDSGIPSFGGAVSWMG